MEVRLRVVREVATLPNLVQVIRETVNPESLVLPNSDCLCRFKYIIYYRINAILFLTCLSGFAMSIYMNSIYMNVSLKSRIFPIDCRFFGHSQLYPTYGDT